MTWLLWITLLLGFIGETVEQKSQRSILLERACAKRPDLEFCGPSSPAVPATSVVPLIIPPAPTTTPSTTTSTTTTTTTEAPTTTTVTLSSSSSSSKNGTDSVEFDEEDASNSTTSETPPEKLGSLVKLPKPEKSNTEKVIDQVIEKSGVATSDEPLKNTTVASVEIEDEKGVLVFVSEYCVLEREKFITKCNGKIPKELVEFCTEYLPTCTATSGVIPVMTYCTRYYKHYPRHCKAQLVEPNALQFCFAFEQFCLPERTATRTQKPKSSLRRCEDVLPEARLKCNPFPSPKDTFNLVRCTQFLTNCRRFVDWLD